MAAPTPSCLSDYAIDLLSDALGVSEPAAQELGALDTDGDGSVTFAEADGATLTSPAGSSFLAIETPENLAFYDGLLQTAWDAANFARFLPTTRGTSDNLTAEEWLLDLHSESGTQELPRWIYGASRLSLFDLACLENATEFLWRANGESGSDQAFFFTLHVPNDLTSGFENAATIELNGAVFTLGDLLKSASVDNRNLARRVFDVLLGAAKNNAPKLPDGFYDHVIDALESCYYRFGKPEEESPPTPPAPPPSQDGPKLSFSFGPVSSSKDPLPVRVDRVQDNVNGVVDQFSAYGLGDEPYSVDIRFDASESPLNDAERLRIATLMNAVSPELYDVLALNGAMDDFSVEVVEDDVLNDVLDGHTLAAYFHWQNKFVIRRSLLSKKTGGGFLKDIFTHEMVHGLRTHDADAQSGDLDNAQKYFLEAAWNDVNARAATAALFPSVSIYSLTNARELLAECALAYLSGEAGTANISDVLHGKKSRAELREKLPEIYLAMRLLFDADSPCFGNLEVFSWESKAFYEAVLASDERDTWLSPKTSAASIARAQKRFLEAGILGF